MRYFPRLLSFFLLIFVTSSLLARPAAGREYILLGTLWVPVAGGPVTLLPVAAAAPAAAFDGHRFLVVWREELAIRAAFFEEGGLEPVDSFVLSTTSNDTHPAVAWDGTRYVVVWRDVWVRVASVSPQGVVEHVESLDLIPDSFAVTAGPNGIALLLMGRTETHHVVDVALVDSDLHLKTTTRVGTMPFSQGFGSTYFAYPAITEFGPGWYAAWLTGRTGRTWSVVGTHITATGQALNVAAYPFETATMAGTILTSAYAFASPLTVDAYVTSSHVVVIPSMIGGPTPAIFVDATGNPTATVEAPPATTFSYYGPRTAHLADGTIVLIRLPSANEPATVTPFIRAAVPLAKRRGVRH
jgi:hypothetical protein